jgi:hypothetical protein
MTISTLRKTRNKLLAATDFLLLPDVLGEESDKTAALAYRVMLRDLLTGITTDEMADAVVMPLPEENIAKMLGISLDPVT